MKRIPALCLAILLLFCCMAGAEDESLSAVDFEDFTLQPGVPLTYRGEKTDGMPLFAFSLTVEGNIALSAVNAVWSREQVQLTPEEFTGSIRNTESEIRSRYEAGGYVLQSLDVRDAVECEYWGQPALRCDAQMQVNINDTEVIIVQRTIRITGSFGTYLFSLSSWSSDYLEEADDALVRAIRWRQP